MSTIAERFLTIARPALDPFPPEAMQEQFPYLDGVKVLSSPSNLFLIQSAVSAMEREGVYCEIGILAGGSLMAAQAASTSKQVLIGVDNWAEAQHYGVNPFDVRCSIEALDNAILHQRDAFDFLRNYNGRPWDVFYYDAGHSFQDTYTALALGRYRLADDALVIVDDTNSGDVRAGVTLACADFGYRVILDLPTPHNGHWTWWNGFTVLHWHAPRVSGPSAAEDGASGQHNEAPPEGGGRRRRTGADAKKKGGKR